jgi:glycosyltransferase involved in cell wall biosynthesis
MGAALTDLQREQIARLPTVDLHESRYELEWMPSPWADVARAGAWLLELERELCPDLIHLNQFAFGALPFGTPALVVAHSCVLSWWRAVHGTRAPRDLDRYRTAVRQGLDRAALVAAPTAAMMRTLATNYGYQREGIVIPNGRSASRYNPGVKKPLILAAGRLWDCAKNLTALEEVASQLPWPILVAGSNAQPGGGIRESRGVEALGDLAPERLAREFARASIYALPARYEPFGLSVLEAALAGCALVLGDIPSLREVWGATALYVPPDDHDALRACLARLMSDDRLRERLAHASRQRALTYTPELMARSYLQAYSIMLKSTRASARVPDFSLPAEFRACAS